MNKGDTIRLKTREKFQDKEDTNWIALEEPKVQVGDERIVSSVDAHGNYIHFIGGKFGHPVGKWEVVR